MAIGLEAIQGVKRGFFYNKIGVSKHIFVHAVLYDRTNGGVIISNVSKVTFWGEEKNKSSWTRKGI